VLICLTDVAGPSQRHARQIHRTQTTGHNRIDYTHTHLRQLGKHQRTGKANQLLDFGKIALSSDVDDPLVGLCARTIPYRSDNHTKSGQQGRKVCRYRGQKFEVTQKSTA